MALIDSITRAISPPEATCATGCIGVFVFALNRKETLSCPSSQIFFLSMLTANRTLVIPSGTSLSGISFSIFLAASVRTVVNCSARRSHSSPSSCPRFTILAISSSLLSILSSFAAKVFFISSSSPTVVTLCFCSNV